MRPAIRIVATTADTEVIRITFGNLCVFLEWANNLANHCNTFFFHWLVPGVFDSIGPQARIPYRINSI